MVKKCRVSVNLTNDEYDKLSSIAESHQVSLAWLGRKAVLELLERYQKDQYSLKLPLEESEPIR